MLRSALIALAGALILGPSAHAAVRMIPVEQSATDATPVVTASGAVLWLDQGADGVERLMRAAPGATTATTVAELPPTDKPLGGPFIRVLYTLAASDERVAIGRVGDICPGSCTSGARRRVIAELFTGTPAGGLVRVQGCGFADGEAACDTEAPCAATIGRTRVDGPTLAYQLDTTAPCSASPPITIDRLGAAPATTTLTGPLGGLAGTYLVTGREPLPAGAGAPATAYDWMAAGGPAVLARAPQPALSAAVTADGILAYVDGGQLFAVGPGRTSSIVGPASADERITAVAGDRILRTLGHRRARVVALTGTAAPTEVPLMDDVSSDPINAPFSFNGTQVAYVGTHCQVQAVVVQPIAEPIPGSCPRPTARSITLRGQEAVIPLLCPAGRLDCVGTFRLKLVANGRRVDRDSGFYIAGEGDANTWSVTLKRGPLRRLRAARAAHVELTLTPFTEQGATPSVAPRTLRIPVRG